MHKRYTRKFRLILDAIKHRYPIQISITNRRGKRITTRTIPEYLEYSEKDDKFRLIGTGSKLGNTINLGRITACEKCENQQTRKIGRRNLPRPRKVIFELVDNRNALERVLSFGPMIRVVKPAAFIHLIKERLSDQKSCGL